MKNLIYGVFALASPALIAARTSGGISSSMWSETVGKSVMFVVFDNNTDY